MFIFYRINKKILKNKKKEKEKEKKLASMVAIFTPLKPSIALWHET